MGIKHGLRPKQPRLKNICHVVVLLCCRVASGAQQLVAMEYRHIPSLAVLMPGGIKLLLVNPAVRRGILLLQKENVVVLGGMVSGRSAG